MIEKFAQPSQMEVVNTPDVLDQVLNSRFGIEVLGSFPAAVHNKYFFGLSLSHSLHGVRSHEGLFKATMHEPKELSLKIRMHVYIGFVKNDGSLLRNASQTT